jgi:tetratricopeptide (TPR) repeat protein
VASTSAAAARTARLELGRAALAVAIGLGLAAIAFGNGGYFPTAWGWGALVMLTAMAGYLVVGDATRPSTLALISLAGLVAFGAWTCLALLWTEDTAATVLEGQRVLLYAGALATLVLLVRRATVPLVLAAALAGVVLASGYGLLTRVFPERLGVYDSTAAYRLEEPLTYWNALGIFAAMGALLALGFAARAQSIAARAAAAGTLPVLFATIYFTFSRGAWIAGAIGLALGVVLDPRRLQLLLAALVLAPASALAVLLSSDQDALTRTNAPLAAASREGHRLAVYVLLLVGASVLIGIGLAAAEARFAPSRQLRLAVGAVLALVAVASLLTVFVRYGGPVELTRKGYDAFTTTKGETPVNLNQRLFTFSGSYRSELWHAAWRDYKANPIVGSGPGTYEEYWNQHRPLQHKVRDAHNLYLEVLAELGPPGLLLLLLALGVPLVAGIAARGHPLVPAALAAYAAYLVHAAVDWDWEMAAVTLTALTCGAALLAAADRRDAPPPLLGPVRIAGVSVALVLAAVAFVGLVGASAMATGDSALDKGRYGEARSEAHKAARWWRWSPEPWRLLGDSQAAEGDLAGARESYRKAISKSRGDWELWYDLSTVTDPPESQRALAEARRLNRYASSDFEADDVPR